MSHSEVTKNARYNQYKPVHDAEQSSNTSNFQLEIDSTNLKSRREGPRRSQVQKAILHLWLFEWFALLLAIAAIACIVVVLVLFNGKPIPDWPYGITLGALVSLLATIATIGITEPLAAGIGQARWIWFTKERSMADFEAIDEAAKGPVGSAWLIMRGKGGFFAIAGGLLLIVSQGIGPFVQQVVQYKSNVVDTSAAAVPTSQEYDTYGKSGVYYNTDVSLSMKAAIQRGILDINANTSTFFVSPNCPTGNCTWGTYPTLSVCGRCADLTSRLTVRNVTDKIGSDVETFLPNNVTLTSTPGLTKQGFIAMTVNTTSNSLPTLVESIAYAEWDWPVLDVFTIIAEYGDVNHAVRGPFASECILQYCVQNFSSSSTNGTFSETVVGDPIYLNGTYTFTVEDQGKDYTLGYETWKGLYAYFQNMFNAVTEQRNGLSATSQWNSDTSQSIFYWTNETYNHMPTRMFENIAASMSLDLRSTGNLSTEGIASSLQTIISVEWAWMGLPFAILLSVGLYLLGVVFATSNKGLEPWKTNSLAVLMHGFADEESRGLIEGAQGLDEMEQIAQTLRMKSVKSASDFVGGHKQHTNLVAS